MCPCFHCRCLFWAHSNTHTGCRSGCGSGCGSGRGLLRLPQQLQESFHLGYFHHWTLRQVLALLDLHTKTQSVESIAVKTMRLQSEPFGEPWCHCWTSGRHAGLLTGFWRACNFHSMLLHAGAVRPELHGALLFPVVWLKPSGSGPARHR